MQDLVRIENNEVVVSSRDVAKNFGKRHADVLESIGRLYSTENSVQSMFFQTTYKDASGKSNKVFLMNRDGFSLLVMGFTGKEALQWKLRYIEAFNEMEEELKDVRPRLSEAEIKLKEKELEVREKEIKCNALMAVLNSVEIPEYKQVMNSLIVKEVSGKEYLPLPECSKPLYTATEIGKMFGVSPQKVGKVANELGLKTEEYGKKFYDKAKYSNKEVISFRYYANALARFEIYFKN